MDWAPIGIEDNGSLQLRSKNCSINLNSGDAAVQHLNVILILIMDTEDYHL
jgi:hypothetical protein